MQNPQSHSQATHSLIPRPLTASFPRSLGMRLHERTHGADGPVDVVVEAEDIPALVPRAEIQQPHVQPVEDVGGLELSIGGPHRSLQRPGQVVQVDGGRRLA